MSIVQSAVADTSRGIPALVPAKRDGNTPARCGRHLDGVSSPGVSPQRDEDTPAMTKNRSLLDDATTDWSPFQRTLRDNEKHSRALARRAHHSEARILTEPADLFQ